MRNIQETARSLAPATTLYGTFLEMIRTLFFTTFVLEIEKLRHFEIETQGYQERLKEKEVIVANMERSLRILQEKLQGINSNREELTMLKSKVQHMQHHMLSARDVADTPNCAYRAKDSKKMTNQESFNKIPQWYSQLRASNA